MLTAIIVVVSLALAFWSAAFICEHLPHVVDAHPRWSLFLIGGWMTGWVVAALWGTGRLS